ncbi:nuclear transport factor 2 family protein [Acidovorax sp. Be4]|uniref:Nuclear transport factor 2 family protein n=1 Tax=Acidovorax bellezanensis TaxID=2976702 RepID=A0ABT2PNX4_9BURK|nr:nuclear transport factor 2 family protein [Acidovorax sp. Be4]MCT9812181.1 nuclear transport factor 2 family protein [Acidovorax sp. Be4]
MNTEMNSEIKALLDREAIRDLRILYAQHLDSNNIAALDQVFSIDAVVEVTVGKMEGIAAIQAGLSDAFKLFDRDHRGRYPFVHAITNHWVKLTGPDTAQGRCYLIDFETASKPDPNPLLLLGLYADEYRRIDGQWRITSTHLEVVWPERNDASAQPANQTREV